MKLILKIGGETYKVTAPEVGYKALLDWAHDIDVTFCTALGASQSTYFFEMDKREIKYLNRIIQYGDILHDVDGLKDEKIGYFIFCIYPTYKGGEIINIEFNAFARTKKDRPHGLSYQGVITDLDPEMLDKLKAVWKLSKGLVNFKVPFKKLK